MACSFVKLDIFLKEIHDSISWSANKMPVFLLHVSLLMHRPRRNFDEMGRDASTRGGGTRKSNMRDWSRTLLQTLAGPRKSFSHSFITYNTMLVLFPTHGMGLQCSKVSRQGLRNKSWHIYLPRGRGGIDPCCRSPLIVIASLQTFNSLVFRKSGLLAFIRTHCLPF